MKIPFRSAAMAAVIALPTAVPSISHAQDEEIRCSGTAACGVDDIEAAEYNGYEDGVSSMHNRNILLTAKYQEVNGKTSEVYTLDVPRDQYVQISLEGHCPGWPSDKDIDLFVNEVLGESDTIKNRHINDPDDKQIDKDSDTGCIAHAQRIPDEDGSKGTVRIDVIVENSERDLLTPFSLTVFGDNYDSDYETPPPAKNEYIDGYVAPGVSDPHEIELISGRTSTFTLKGQCEDGDDMNLVLRKEGIDDPIMVSEEKGCEEKIEITPNRNSDAIIEVRPHKLDGPVPFGLTMEQE